MSGISFFRSGSSLISDKLEKLEQSAAVTENLRVTRMQQEKKTKELSNTEREMHTLEKRQKTNTEEISRRQRLISELDKKEQILRTHMYELTKKAVHKEGDTSPAVTTAFKEYSKQLDRISSLKKLQLSEIEHLDMQNRGLDRKFEKTV
jgi:flagellar biosynthesis GTPase FlhF